MIVKTEKVALVTGASGGIGAAVARRLHGHGFQVALHGNQSQGALDDLGDELSAPTFVADFAGADAPAHLARDVQETCGSLDVLINNAGTITQTTIGDREDLRRDLEHVSAINLYAPIELMSAALDGMRRKEWGRIVNISSLYGVHGSPWVLPYSVSKAGLDSATKALALAAAESGVTVNAIAPGNIDTAMTQRAGPEYIEMVTERTPLKRLGEPDEVATVVEFLVGCGFVTGQTIVLDGGLSLVQ